MPHHPSKSRLQQPCMTKAVSLWEIICTAIAPCSDSVQKIQSPHTYNSQNSNTPGIRSPWLVTRPCQTARCLCTPTSVHTVQAYSRTPSARHGNRYRQAQTGSPHTYAHPHPHPHIRRRRFRWMPGVEQNLWLRTTIITQWQVLFPYKQPALGCITITFSVKSHWVQTVLETFPTND